MVKGLKKIVLITSGQPSLNPRLVKEADTLVANGYEVTVIYQYWNDWATALDKILLAEKSWRSYRVGGDPQREKLTYWLSRIRNKIAIILSRKLGYGNGRAEAALGRCTYSLMQKASKIKADIYLAHNLAALPAAVISAKKNNAKCGFDAEDFHRNEVSDDPGNFDVLIKTFVENKYIPQLNYFSTASPLITDAYQTIYSQQNPFTILNVFPKQKLKIPKNTGGPLKLCWFSQTIGPKRGLEQIIRAIGAVSADIELHLLGNYDEATKNYFDQLAKENNFQQLFYYKPIAADKLFSFLSNFDIGLATEIGEPKNRDICLTNKIFTYIHCGLAILASATSAQQQLLELYPNMGLVYATQADDKLTNLIQQLATTPQLLAELKQNALKYANEELNWENESIKLIANINQLT